MDIVGLYYGHIRINGKTQTLIKGVKNDKTGIY